MERSFEEEFEVLESENRKTYSDSIQGYIYHYTGAKGLYNILKSKTLYFTESSYLNDSSEGKYIYSLVEKCLDSSGYCDGFKKDVTKFILNECTENDSCNSKYDLRIFNRTSPEQYTPKNKYFLCCFSENNDSLPMWNYYTKENNSAGYCIGFYISLLYSYVEELKNKYRCDIVKGKIVYNIQEQEKIVTDALEIGNRHWNKQEEDCNQSCIIDRLYKFFESCSFFFKHPSFSNEEEIRIVIKMDVSTFERHFNINEPFNEIVKLRLQSGMFVPYLELNFSDVIEQKGKQSIINSIKLSPTISNEKVKESVGLLTKKFGFPHCEIGFSEIPFRII